MKSIRDARAGLGLVVPTLVAALGLATGAAGQPPPPLGAQPGEPIDIAAVDALLGEYARRRVFSGEVLISVADRTLLHKRYGFARWPTREPLPEGGVYMIGSVTKQFTAAAILRLEEQGLLSTEDALGKHIPELPDALKSSRGVPVTLHHLVTHTSGMPNPLYANFWGPEKGFEVLAKALQGCSLRHVPGAEFHYNNTGYALLGEVIRRASGQSFDAFTRRELFEPMGLGLTGVKLDARQSERVVTGHVSDVLRLVPSQAAFGRFIKGRHDWDLLASGNVSSTVSDLQRWVRGLQEGTLFSADRVDKMLTPALRGYAYGWVKRSVDEWSEPLYWHNGAIIPFGYTAEVGWTRGSKLCIVILSNLDDSAAAQEVLDDVLRVGRGKRPEEPRAGWRARHSYFTIQVLALLLGGPLLTVLFLLHAIWSLGLRAPQSRLGAYTTTASTLSLGVFVAAVLADLAGVSAAALAVGLAGWHLLRSRSCPWLHQVAWKQWIGTAGTALSCLLLLALAAFVIEYF